MNTHGCTTSSALASARSVTIWINGEPYSVSDGTVLSAALLSAGRLSITRSTSGQWRGPLCGMGICFECRATVDGQPLVRTCQVLCREGMQVQLPVE